MDQSPPEPVAARNLSVVVLAPVGADALVTARLLQAEGMVAVPCRDLSELTAHIRAGAGVALLTEEALEGDDRGALTGALREQPPWSDFPLVLLCSGGVSSVAAQWALEHLPNVLPLERPVRVATLLGALRNALRARSRQYQIQDHVRERERTAAELRVQAEHLRRSNAELERFAYVASHDLQEPLRAVLSYTQLLDGRYRGTLGEDADEFLAYIVRGAQRMHRLINDLLAFSRVEAAPRNLAQVDIGRVVRQVVQDLQPTIQESGATVEVGELPVLLANETQIGQVFLNLIGNALKFRADRPARIAISSREESGSWVFTVADNGIGIEPQHVDRIFGLFQRLHGSDRYPGTGIGLAICSKIVERYGGRIWVESVPGGGSSFRFSLPGHGHDEKARRPPHGDRRAGDRDVVPPAG